MSPAHALALVIATLAGGALATHALIEWLEGAMPPL